MSGPDVAPVDGAAALALLEAAVETRGADYVYDYDDGCVYVRDGQPSCLIGTALALHGVPIGVLSGWDTAAAVDDSKIFSIVDAGLAPFIDGDALRAFRAAQKTQDGGKPWATALKAARVALSQTGDSE